MRKTYRLSRVGTLRIAFVVGSLYFAFGVLTVLAGLINVAFGNSDQDLATAALKSLSVPVLFAVSSVVMTGVACGLYNFIAGKTGGIEWEVNEVGSPTPRPADPEPEPAQMD